MNNKTPRWLALVGLVCLLGAVVVVYLVPEANQYELSLYDAYPLYFWALLIGSMFLGTMVILADARQSEGRSWLFGLALVLLADTILLLLPYLRGYKLWGRGDTLSHIGFARDIVADGDIGANIYPPIHLLMVAISEAAGIELAVTTLFLPFVFSVVYLGGMFYLLRTLFGDRTQVLYGLVFVLLPILGPAHTMLRPFDMSLALVPLVLYLFVKSQRSPTTAVRAVFVFALVGFVFYHPLTALFGIILFFLYVGGRYAPRVREQFASPTNFVSLSVAVFAIWYTNYAGIILRFNRLYETLFGSSGGSAPISGYTQTAQEASPALIDLVRVAFFKYGIEGVLFGLGFAFIGLLLLLIRQGDYAITTYDTMLAGSMALFSLGGLAFLVLPLIVPHERPFQIAKITAVILSGQLFLMTWDVVGWQRHTSLFETGFRATTAVVLLLVISLSVFTLYPAPLQSESNEQVTEMELSGTKWLTEHGTATNRFLEFDMRYYRFYHAQYGIGTHPFEGGSSAMAPPPHFNYTEYGTLGQSYETDQYMLITRKGRIVYPQGFPDYSGLWRYDPADFEQIERDTTIHRTYDNGDVQLYYVDGVGNMTTEATGPVTAG
ncbi:hypothetical protein [Haloarcula sebkhae]|uniref:Glycosyltransferase RgtA/B/C/D-like domain-containing protein n=2 Tax=Haloarcula sebkhae TaxID=932660 RepID=A0A830F0D6_9EURY|nr:hypothetical protein [Haloarcula sebkhae]GGK72754.1 hypothetical protein GCM10009067_26280 [Haloarcula sebkhae]